MNFKKVKDVNGNTAFLPTSSIRRPCPKCGKETRYRKTDHYGDEGQWCDNCKTWVELTW